MRYPAVELLFSVKIGLINKKSRYDAAFIILLICIREIMRLSKPSEPRCDNLIFGDKRVIIHHP